MRLALVMSKRCTASCGHCSTNCGPSQTQALAREQLLRLMDEAAAIDDGEELHFHLTGGEPFMDFDTLLAVVSQAGSLKARVGCTTNAFWARTETIATQKLRMLRDAGLGTLAVSTSRFHEEFVPLRSVEIALRAATRLGMDTELKGAVTKSDLGRGANLERWRERLDADMVSIFPVIPYLREAASLPDGEYIRDKGLPDDRCPSEVLTIEPDGVAMSCCGQASQSRFLALGTTHDDSLATLNARLKSAAGQQLLRATGPIAFARAAIAAGQGHLLRDAYAGPCDLCVHIATHPELRRIADDFTARAEAAAPATSQPVDETTKQRKERKTLVKAKKLEQLQSLIARAARDATLREALVEAPVTTLEKVARKHVDAESIEVVESIKRALRRFGGNPDLNEDDAHSWAVGVLARCGAADDDGWTIDPVGNHAKNNTWLIVKNNPKNNKPKKAKTTTWPANKAGKKKAKHK